MKIFTAISLIDYRLLCTFSHHNDGEISMTRDGHSARINSEDHDLAVNQQALDFLRIRLEQIISDLLGTLIFGLYSASEDLNHEAVLSSRNLRSAADRIHRHPDVFLFATSMLEANQLVTNQNRLRLKKIRKILAAGIVKICGTLDEPWKNIKQIEELSENNRKTLEKRLASASSQLLDLIEALKSAGVD